MHMAGEDWHFLIAVAAAIFIVIDFTQQSVITPRIMSPLKGELSLAQRIYKTS